MKKLLPILLLSATACTRYERDTPNSIPRFAAGDRVKLNDIRIPELREPVVVDSVYYDGNYAVWAYDGVDANGRKWEHFVQYQLKKY